MKRTDWEILQYTVGLYQVAVEDNLVELPFYKNLIVGSIHLIAEDLGV